MNFSRFRYGDIQSWWEVPSIAYFCSLFRTAFNLLDFDIEELEEALLTDGTEESASSLLTELIVRLLNGCLGNNDISAFNYQMYLRRLFRRKCQETGRVNPFDNDIDFQFLPLRTKVEILYALCDFRLDAEDVFDLFKNLEAESLRVEPLGWDDNYSAYWYFYGTRLYREDLIKKSKAKIKKKKLKESKRRSCFYGDDWLDEEETERVWQVVCFTEDDWAHLTEKFSKATSKVEKELYRSLSQNFLPEIPRLFQEKERLQRKRLLELAPRRTSNRVLQKIKKGEETKVCTDDNKDEDEDERKDTPDLARENRAKRRNAIRSKSVSSDSSETSESLKEEMPQKVSKRSKSQDKRSKNSSATHKGEPPPEPPIKTGRKTNNSLASATGQILIPEHNEPINSTRKKLKTSQIFSQTEEDIQTDMYKVLEQITAHEDAWPFMDPVEEEYAPNYYAVIRRPMDLRKMEERLDNGYYMDFSMFKADFKLIVNNCRLYNGQDNEYTMMVDNLQLAFDRLTEKYMRRLSSSDEEIAVEYQLPTPSRKHKLKSCDSPDLHKKKKRISDSDTGEPLFCSDITQEAKHDEELVQSKEANDKPLKAKRDKHGRLKEDKEKHSKDKEKHVKVKEEKEKHVKVKEEKEKHTKVKEDKEKHVQVLEGDEQQDKVKESREKHAKIKKDKERLAKVKESREKHMKVKLDKDKHAKVNREKEKHAKIKEIKERHAKAKHIRGNHSKEKEDEEQHANANEDNENPVKVKEEIEKHSDVKEENEKHVKVKDENEKHAKLKEDKEKRVKIKEDKEKQIKVKEEKEKQVKVKEEKEKPIKIKEEVIEDEIASLEIKKSKESHKSKQGKGRKKRKGHHRHGKHSKNHKKDSHKSEHGETKKHSKKQKHGKNKEGKKSKQKKKKSKHHIPEPEPEPSEVRPKTPDSTESSNRSRSASPLPSIHTPSPSPTEFDKRSPPRSPPPSEPSDQLSDPDFFKDKYDKIKERRRHAAKDAFESLFDLKQKVIDKQKHNLNIPEKDKHQKLRETIEKLKAKNEKYKDPHYSDVYSPGSSGAEKTSDSKYEKDTTNKKETDGREEGMDKKAKTKTIKKGSKKNSAKNESASEALEEAVKDISKWLEEAPKGSAVSSPSDSPAQTTSTEDQDNSRHDDELSQGEKSIPVKKETGRKRPSSREPKVLKRREIQRTIDRLQPGKSKGNLLTNISNKNTEKAEETATLGVINKERETEEHSPKLSLGSVLPTVDFSLGKDHKFENKEESAPKIITPTQEPLLDIKDEMKEEENTHVDKKIEEVAVQVTKKDAEVETEPQIMPKPSQEKATPNLSAWFKAFGAPKNPTSTTIVKKKPEETEAEEKQPDTTNNNESKTMPSPKNPVKYDSPIGPDTPNPEGGESPVPVNATPRQRKTSTGSSVSERSSFSQDLDSPRHQMSHMSPLLRSPASPRTEEFQKITYPIINGSVRAGFYQDTTSIKSSPEKSCSPREAPHSPYSPYSQHVYAGNNPAGSATPHYFVDHNKSPMPSYTQNTSAYYDATKAAVVNKPPRAHEEFTNINPEPYPPSQYARPYSPTYPPYTQPPITNYSQPRQSPQPPTASPPIQVIPSTTPDTKTTHFPVKKRMYSEPEQAAVSPPKVAENKEPVVMQTKNDYSKISQTLHPIPPLATPSVDDIALALSEKSEMAKLRENNAVDYATNDRHVEERSNSKADHVETPHDLKKDISTVDLNKPVGIMKKDNIDMVNMGYMNPEIERRSSGDTHEIEFSIARDISKPIANTQQKVYDVDAIALNLGINSQPLQKTLTKSNPVTSNIPPAHSQERSHSDMTINHNVAHSHHANQYDHMSGGQTISNFSMSDIELANKKLYSCNTPSSTAIDYGNWKLTNQMRKPEMMPSDYSTAYNTNPAEKLHKEINAATSNAISYNKNMQQQQYNMAMYNVPRASSQRTQDLQQSLPAELRIPNPRGHLKNDHMNVSSTINDPDPMAKNMDSIAKSQKPEKLVQNHPLVTSNPYKTPYSNTALPLDSLRTLPNIPQMLERYTNDDRFLTSFAGNSSSLYHDKQFQMAQMFNKNLPSEMPSSSTTPTIYSQPSAMLSKDNSVYKTSNITTSHADTKTKSKRKRMTETKPAQIVSQAYHTSPCTTDVLSSVKSGMMPASAFNFGSTTNMATNMALSSGLYGDNTGFSAMAANYMVAAVAHQQRNSAETSAEKLVKPAHQNSSHTTSAFPFGLGHSQVRGGYPFVGAEPSSPLYQQYLQRHQEELLRQTGQIMSLYPGPYPASLGVARQPYDTMNRHSWL